MKVSANFELKEFVDPVTCQLRGEKALSLVDSRIIAIVQFLRDHFKVTVVVNNWHTGGQYKESGTRSFLAKTGATFSQHKFGRAADIKVSGWEAEDVRNEIRKLWPKLKELGLTRIEKDTPTWVHLDCANTGLDYLLEVPYK